jgi:Pumilio-family RNA binding repeat
MYLDACHVWQKLLEIRWSKSPPQYMKYVNEALRGMWPNIALSETGSLVVQNIFENCLEEDKVCTLIKKLSKPSH